MSEIPRMTIDELVAQVRGEYAAWQSALVSVPFEQMETPLDEGGWSVKDHIAHVTWFEREMVRLIETHSLASGSPYWYQEPEVRNGMIHADLRGLALADVLRQADEIHARLVTLLTGLDETDLNSAEAYTAMPDDWVPWIIFAQNTYEHYRDHADVITTHF